MTLQEMIQEINEFLNAAHCRPLYYQFGKIVNIQEKNGKAIVHFTDGMKTSMYDFELKRIYNQI